MPVLMQSNMYGIEDWFVNHNGQRVIGSNRSTKDVDIYTNTHDVLFQNLFEIKQYYESYESVCNLLTTYKIDIEFCPLNCLGLVSVSLSKDDVCLVPSYPLLDESCLVTKISNIPRRIYYQEGLDVFIIDVLSSTKEVH